MKGKMWECRHQSTMLRLSGHILLWGAAVQATCFDVCTCGWDKKFDQSVIIPINILTTTVDCAFVCKIVFVAIMHESMHEYRTPL